MSDLFLLLCFALLASQSRGFSTYEYRIYCYDAMNRTDFDLREEAMDIITFIFNDKSAGPRRIETYGTSQFHELTEEQFTMLYRVMNLVKLSWPTYSVRNLREQKQYVRRIFQLAGMDSAEAIASLSRCFVGDSDASEDGTESGMDATDRGVVATERGVDATDRGVDATDRAVDTTDRVLSAIDRGVDATDRVLSDIDRGVDAEDKDTEATTVSTTPRHTGDATGWADSLFVFHMYGVVIILLLIVVIYLLQTRTRSLAHDEVSLEMK